MKIRRILSAALAAACLCAALTIPSFASLRSFDDDDLSGGLSAGTLTNNLTPTSATTLSTSMESGIYWIGSWDTYQALNLQYDNVNSSLVLDGQTFERNELWILKPVNGAFTLSPLSHPDYFVVAQGNSRQLCLSRTSSSDSAAQWMAVAGTGGRYVLVNCKSGLAMDTEYGGYATGTRVLSYSRHNGNNQQWSMIRVSESTSTISFGRRVAPANDKYAILSSGNNAKGVNNQFASNAGNGTAKIVLDTFNGESNECWIFTNQGNNQYTIAPSNNPNICINVWAANPTAGNQLTLAQYQPGDQCSLWEIYQDGDNFGFRNVKTGLWLNLWMNSHTDGSKIVGYRFDNSAAMKWRLVPVSPAPVPSSTWQYPVSSAYVCGNDWSEYYAPRASAGRPDHCGIDIKSRTGNTAVCAAANGVIVKAGWNSANGNYVVIQHSLSGKTVYSFYAHLASISRSSGSVQKGTQIGVIGNTGSSSAGVHLHFAVTDTLWSGSYYGYVPSFSGNKVSYSGVTYYNPHFIVSNGALPN